MVGIYVCVLEFWVLCHNDNYLSDMYYSTSTGDCSSLFSHIRGHDNNYCACLVSFAAAFSLLIPPFWGSHDGHGISRYSTMLKFVQCFSVLRVLDIRGDFRNATFACSKSLLYLFIFWCRHFHTFRNSHACTPLLPIIPVTFLTSLHKLVLTIIFYLRFFLAIFIFTQCFYNLSPYCLSVYLLSYAQTFFRVHYFTQVFT
jgi:hypothetical protein